MAGLHPKAGNSFTRSILRSSGSFHCPLPVPLTLPAASTPSPGSALVFFREVLVAREIPTAESLRDARTRAHETRARMIALQEELDWCCCRLYGVTGDDLCMPSADSADVPAVRLGERAFEIVLARKIAAGQVETKWFERHGSTPITEIPAHWPPAYRALVQRRIDAIENNANIALIEQPEYKRRWNDEPWETQQERALRGWLLDRLEAPPLWSEPRLTTTAALADRMRDDAEFLQVAELYTGRPDFDVARLVAGLVEDQSVPLLPVLRYKPSGLRKREAWERTWELQRREDAVDARTKLPAADPEHLTPEQAAALKAAEIGTIPVPPRYGSADFRKAAWWRLRGKLDVPKERFVSLPYCEREADPSLVIGWAGWNALEQSRAVAAYFHQVREQEGWTAERLTPLLAALLELLPWVRQYHNAPDPEFDTGMGDYFEGFIDEEARSLSLTHEAIRAWAPPAGRARRGNRNKTDRRNRQSVDDCLLRRKATHASQSVRASSDLRHHPGGTDFHLFLVFCAPIPVEEVWNKRTRSAVYHDGIL